MKIVINGVAHDYPHNRIGYDEVAELIGRPKNRELTVTYSSGSGALQRHGSLMPWPGDGRPMMLEKNKRKMISVDDGMVFNAVVTGNA